MTANFFQSLDQNGVEYLLISGQTTVLYGAATFSEDIDLWINPTWQNCDRFMAALTENQASYYKLTPPLSIEHLEYGHGFHFVIPGGDDGEIYLDVMGKPPRTGVFKDSLVTAQMIKTGWGVIRTIGVVPLVELKKTQRLGDYPIISKLALAWFEQPDCKKSDDDFLWALQNIFTLSELAIFFTEFPVAVQIAAQNFNQDVGEFGRQLFANGETSEAADRRVGDYFQSRISELQSNDRQYWRDIIRRLKELRANGELMPEGSKV